MNQRYFGPVKQANDDYCVSMHDSLRYDHCSGDLLCTSERICMERLDETDERILAELTEHARATFAEIGQKVSLSVPAVKRRVDRMVDSGVIKGFTTVVDRTALGWKTEAYVQGFCHGRIAPDELRAAWGDIPEGLSPA